MIHAYLTTDFILFYYSTIQHDHVIAVHVVVTIAVY